MQEILEYLKSRRYAYRRSGDHYAMARCPFHDDASPSLSVTIHTGTYRCFGCGARGDLVNLIARLEGVSLSAAITKARQLRAEAAHV